MQLTEGELVVWWRTGEHPVVGAGGEVAQMWLLEGGASDILHHAFTRLPRLTGRSEVFGVWPTLRVLSLKAIHMGTDPLIRECLRGRNNSYSSQTAVFLRNVLHTLADKRGDGRGGEAVSWSGSREQGLSLRMGLPS